MLSVSFMIASCSQSAFSAGFRLFGISGVRTGSTFHKLDNRKPGTVGCPTLKRARSSRASSLSGLLGTARHELYLQLATDSLRVTLESVD
jgi:hypothetical protein